MTGPQLSRAIGVVVAVMACVFEAEEADAQAVIGGCAGAWVLAESGSRGAWPGVLALEAPASVDGGERPRLVLVELAERDGLLCLPATVAAPAAKSTPRPRPRPSGGTHGENVDIRGFAATATH